MKNVYIIFLALVLLMFGSVSQAQTKMIGNIQDSDEIIDVASFDEELFSRVLIYQLNYLLADSLHLEGFVLHEFFIGVAQEHATMMAEAEDATLEGDGEYRDPRSRLQMAGGTGSGDEIVLCASIRNGDENFTYRQLADYCIARWLTSGKTSKPMLAQQYYFAGVSAKLDKEKRRAYISFYMGNWESFKQGSERYEELPFPVARKKYGLKPPDQKLLAKAKRKAPNLLDWQQGLEILPTGEIVFKYPDLKGFKRVMRNGKDGLAVDIVQKSQFDKCGETNIVDFGGASRGILLKPVYSKKILKKNQAPGEGRRNKVKKIEIVLGHMPEGLSAEDVELNLVFIQQKSACKNIHPTYIDKEIYNFAQKVGLLPDLREKNYFPEATSNKLTFRIPFEQGKFKYDSDDMIPVLKALNGPAFIINKIHIAAYSSLEGTESENSALQKKRANSIVSALEENQNASIIDSITTAPNFEDLKRDVKGTPYEAVATMNYQQAIQYVNAHAREMESILKNHRYADVTVWVTYDVKGDKEQAYVLDQFNKDVEAGRLDDALAKQKYMFNRILDGRYNSKAVSGMRIPNGKEYVGLNMNKICMERIINNYEPIDSSYLERVDDLAKLDGANLYVRYNDIFCEMMMEDLKRADIVDGLQTRIDNLYQTPLNKDAVDLLNIELQYQVMNIYKDSLGFDHPIVVASLERIKQIVGYRPIDWENALKMAGIFINHYDYDYAYSLLLPWIDENVVSTSLLYSFVSLSSKVDYKIYSNTFLIAMEKIREQDPKGFCKLFKGDKFSVQVFANEKLKEMYCTTCKK